MSCPIWLEITDCGAAAEGGHRVTLRWQVEAHSGDTALAFTPPLAAGAVQLAQDYTQRFRCWRPEDRDEAYTAEHMLLTLGRAIGNALVDSGYRLLTFGEYLERAAIAELHVVVRSSHPAFLQVPWELMVLPDSPYTLSAAAAAFVRAPQEAAPFSSEARRLGLGDAPEGRPLRYLCIDAAAPEAPLAQRVSLAWTQLSWQGALEYRLAPSVSCSDPLNDERFAEHHVVHYCGPISNLPTGPHLQISSGVCSPDMAAADFCLLYTSPSPRD